MKKEYQAEGRSGGHKLGLKIEIGEGEDEKLLVLLSARLSAHVIPDSSLFCSPQPLLTLLTIVFLRAVTNVLTQPCASSLQENSYVLYLMYKFYIKSELKNHFHSDFKLSLFTGR